MAAQPSFLGQARQFLESRQEQRYVVAIVLAPLAGGLFTGFARYPVDLSSLSPGGAVAASFVAWLALEIGLWLGVSRLMIGRGVQTQEAFRLAALAFIPLFILPTTFPPVVLKLGPNVEGVAFWLCVGLLAMNLVLVAAGLPGRGKPSASRAGLAMAFLDALFLAIIAGFGLRLLLLYYNHGFNPWDEGFIDDSAQRILTGAVMYRDFQSPWAPGSHYLLALIFRVFGTTLFVGKCLRPLYAIPCALGLYLVGRRVTSPVFAFLPALFLLVLGEGSLALIFALAAFLLAFELRLSQWASWLAAGVCAGLAALFKQEVGGWTAVSLAFVALIRDIGFIRVRFGAQPTDRTLGRAALVPLIIGIAIPIIPVAAYFAVQGALGIMLRDLTVYPYSQVLGAIRLEPPPLLPVFPRMENWTDLVGHVGRLEFYAPGAVYIATALLLLWRAWHRNLSETDMLAAALLVFGVLLYWSAFGRADFYHLNFAAPPAYLLGAFLLEWSLHGLWRAFRREGAGILRNDLRAVTALIVFAPMIYRFAVVKPRIGPMIHTPGWFAYHEGWVPLHLPRAGRVILPPDEAAAFEGLANRIWELTLPTDPIFALPNNPGTYFLADRDNPTRYPLLYPGVLNEDLQKQVSQTLEEQRVRVLVFNGMEWDGRRLDDYMPVLMKYIRENYQPGEKFGDYRIWLRKPEG